MPSLGGLFYLKWMSERPIYLSGSAKCVFLSIRSIKLQILLHRKLISGSLSHDSSGLDSFMFSWVQQWFFYIYISDVEKNRPRSATRSWHHPQCCTSYLGHLLLPLSFGCLSVGIVVSLYQNEVVGLWVDDKFPGSVLQRKGHLVEDGSQFLQGQNPVTQIVWRGK